MVRIGRIFPEHRAFSSQIKNNSLIVGSSAVVASILYAYYSHLLNHHLSLSTSSYSRSPFFYKPPSNNKNPSSSHNKQEAITRRRRMIPEERCQESSPIRSRRLRFALFIKVIFKVIDDKLVRDQAKTILSSCIKLNRRGGGRYALLMDAIERPLRGLVGDSIWLCAYHYTELYHHTKNRLPQQRNERLAWDWPDDLSEDIPNVQERLLYFKCLE
jgi:hypothetical protein